ncbi:FUSC family protein [Micromonospora sp. 067-2]|uniref:FUSC family protein n=1 Tax=Micromonospora sp. 067-2 TaxID=2789270 RepID=UPI00397B5813
MQAGLAAGLAWALARQLAVSANPVFAPISAVATIAAAVGQRLRRTVQLIAGVALGVGIGDALIALMGRGAAQLGLIVIATILLGIALTGRSGVIPQAGGTAVLVSTVAPQAPRVDGPQIANAVIGGLIALVVVIVVLPLNPLRTVERAARPLLETLSRQLAAASRAIETRDAAGALRALDQFRAMGSQVNDFTDALQGAAEVTHYSPQRRHRRNSLQQYQQTADHAPRVVNAASGLVRRAATAINDQEPLPSTLADAVAELGQAVQELHRSCSYGRHPDQARHRSLKAVSQAAKAGADGLRLSGTVVLAQVRTAAAELLQATGLSRRDANRLVRQAAHLGASTAP